MHEGYIPLTRGKYPSYYPPMISAREQLLAEIEAFLARQQMSPTHFGRAALNDNKFLKRLREGASCSLDTADKLRAFMRTYAGNARPKQRPLTGAAA